MDNQPKIWVLADDRAGNVNQALGLAEALELPFETKKIVYTKSAGLPNFLRGSSLIGVNLADSSEIKAPWPDIIIAAGRKTGPIARYIKKMSGGKSKIVQLMLPGFPSGDFDLIVTPKHDGFSNNKKIINTIGATNRITMEKISHDKEKWQAKFANLPKPRIALLIGGTTKKGTFTIEHALDLADKASKFANSKGGSLLITNSRRTGDEATRILKEKITAKFHFHDFNSKDENPYFGYLGISDAIIASGDSISMCSEACSTGKPVYIYAPADITPEKHQNFHKNLYTNGYAKPLTGEWVAWNNKTLCDTNDIAQIIKKIYC